MENFDNSALMGCIILFGMIIALFMLNMDRARQKEEDLINSEEYKYFQSQPPKRRKK